MNEPMYLCNVCVLRHVAAKPDKLMKIKALTIRDNAPSHCRDCNHTATFMLNDN